MIRSKWIFILGVSMAFAQVAFAVDVSIVNSQYPVVVYKGKNTRFEIKFQKNRPATWVNYGEVSAIARHTIRISEDWSFFQHQGIDVDSMKEALKKDLEKGRLAHGASTISQQVVKNLFTSRERTVFRKVNEIMLTMELEKKTTKQKIFEIYLNIAEMGEGIFGIGPASQFYFNKHPRDLRAKEAAFLAMLLPSPKKYSQSFRSKKLSPYASKIIRSLLGKLQAGGYLSPEEREREWAQPLSFEPSIPAAPSPVPTPESSGSPSASPSSLPGSGT